MKKLLPMVFLLLLSSCSGLLQEPIVDDDNSPKDAISEYEVSIEDAIKIAEKYRQELSSGAGTTRSCSPIKSIETIKNHKTRSEGESAIENYFYLINYSGDGGFALLGADKRMAPLYAVSDDGQLSMQDTLWNPGLSSMINSYINQANETIDDPYQPVDSLITGLTPPYANIIIHEEQYKVCSPVLTPYVRQWHQEAPYNNCTLELYNQNTQQKEHALVGCLPLSLGMIMSYYEYPESYVGYAYDWPAMKTGKGDWKVAHLVACLGHKDNLQATYGFKGTSASVRNIPRALGNFGYHSPKGQQSYSSVMTPTIIEIKNPMLVVGNSNDGGGCHAWVIDGSIWHHIPAEISSDYRHHDYHYIHCVWGWGGSGNGYYLAEASTLGGTCYKPDADDLYTYGIDFKYHVDDIWTDIKPLK